MISRMKGWPGFFYPANPGHSILTKRTKAAVVVGYASL